MTDYWKTIRDRLHEESGLHHPLNPMNEMFEHFFNGMLEQYREDDRLFVDQGFLITASGLYLDIRGKELGLPRREGEYAHGIVEFTLTHEIDKNTTPRTLTNVGEGIDDDVVIYDFRPEDVQILLDRLNEERLNKNLPTIIEPRQATAKFTIPEGISVYSDVGFEYILSEPVTFEVGQEIAYGMVRAKESGSRYNTQLGTIQLLNDYGGDIDVTSKTVELTKQKSNPIGYTYKTGIPESGEESYEIIVKDNQPVYKVQENKVYLKEVYDIYGVKNPLKDGESVVKALFKTTIPDGSQIIQLPISTITRNGVTIKFLDYTDLDTYKFLTYVKSVDGSELNKDLTVTNTEAITGGVDGEEDDAYRLRLLNSISTNISINYLKRQGILIYSKTDLEEDVRTKLTSFNPYLNNKYCVIPPDSVGLDFVKNELITEYCFVVYIKGW